MTPDSAVTPDGVVPPGGAVTPDAIAAIPVELPRAPYRGIEAFRYVDYPIFFAREKDIHNVRRFITIYRALLLYGDSGAGKSSLVNAGLINAALDEGFIPERLRVQPHRDEEIVVERVSTNPTGDAPYLPSIFAAPGDTAPRVVLSTRLFLGRLNELCRQEGGRAAVRPLLIFDQFEEFITLFEDAPPAEEKEEALAAQKEILLSVVRLITDPSLAVKILLVFREDYLAKFSKLFLHCPDLQHQSIRLPSLSAAALDDVVRGPFDVDKLTQKLRRNGEAQARAGALKMVETFRESGTEIPEELAHRLIQSVGQAGGSVSVNLSEVQIACQSLWQKRESVDLFLKGGVGALLEEYLSNALGQLAGDLRDPALALLSRMVIPPTTRNVISRFTLFKQVHEEEGFDEALIEKALDALVEDTKIVRLERRNNTFFVELISEFLVPWIVRQKVLREEKLNQQRRDEERRRQEEERQQRELVKGQKRKKRMAYLIAAAGAVSALMMAYLAWAAYDANSSLTTALAEKEKAQFERKIADKEKARAEAEVSLRTEKILREEMVQQARQEAEQAKANAEEARRQAQTKVAEATRQVDWWRNRAQRLEAEVTRGGSAGGAAPISEAQWIEHVKWVKKALNITQGENIPVDGIYDARTRRALVAFQRKYNLTDDGVAGPQTIHKLRELLAGVD